VEDFGRAIGQVLPGPNATQQFVRIGQMIGNVAQHVSKRHFGVDAIELCCRD
jgi:hypothetical protein